jgi:hypothetical protein
MMMGLVLLRALAILSSTCDREDKKRLIVTTVQNCLFKMAINTIFKYYDTFIAFDMYSKLLLITGGCIACIILRFYYEKSVDQQQNYRAILNDKSSRHLFGQYFEKDLHDNEGNRRNCSIDVWLCLLQLRINHREYN